MMKKLILLGVILVNVAFGVDCNAMIKRYINNLSALIKSCTENHNADACFCGSAVAGAMGMKAKQDGDIDNANMYFKAGANMGKLACKLGKKEACRMLDKAGVEY